MEQVRKAVTELREGKVVRALERLAADGRITEAGSGEEAYEALVDAWYTERQRRVTDPSPPRSAMTVEHHAHRRELNRRARERLAGDGTLHGPELTVGELSFRAGDELVARVADRELRAEGAPRSAYVRNGSTGTVDEVRDEGLVVNFKRWGPVPIPRSYLEMEAPGARQAGLQHAYALTTYTAQGETFAAATPLVSDASTQGGAYVAMTRAQRDLHAFAVRLRNTRPKMFDDDLPRLPDETGALEAAERRLRRDPQRRLAVEGSVGLDVLAQRHVAHD